MSINSELPDYELQERALLTAPRELKAMAHPLRSTLLDLVLERAATVSELAAAVGRPKSTVAHHVGVLVDAGLFRVVRTRRVRAIDERFYGRTARVFYVGEVPLESWRRCRGPTTWPTPPPSPTRRTARTPCGPTTGMPGSPGPRRTSSGSGWTR